MNRILLICFLLPMALVFSLEGTASAQTKKDKALAAHKRALTAYSSGDLETAASEAVMATTLDPRAVYFYTAARLYFAQDDLDLAALYAQKAGSADGRDEAGARSERERLAMAVEKRGQALLLKIPRACPSEVKREDLEALGKVITEVRAGLLDAFDAHQGCFLAEFPELPRPLKVRQRGEESVSPEEGAFIVQPGGARIHSGDHPVFEMELQGTPGERVVFRPRGEPWMQASVSLKGSPRNAEYFLDGERIEIDAEGLKVSPKEKHRLVVTAPGRQKFKSDRFALPFGGTQLVEVRSHKKRTWVPWLLMGVGAVGAGLGGYFMYDGSAKASDFESGLERNDHGFVTNVGRGAALTSQDEANASWQGGLGGVIAGGTMVLSGVLWMILEDTTPPEWRE